MNASFLNKILLERYERQNIQYTKIHQGIFFKNDVQMRIICHKGFKAKLYESEMDSDLDFSFVISHDFPKDATPFQYLKEMSTKGFPILKRHIYGIVKCQDKEQYASIMLTYDCSNFEAHDILNSAGIYSFLVQNLTPDEYKNLQIHALFNFKTNEFTHYVFTDKGDDITRILFEGF